MSGDSTWLSKSSEEHISKGHDNPEFTVISTLILLNVYCFSELIQSQSLTEATEKEHFLDVNILLCLIYVSSLGRQTQNKVRRAKVARTHTGMKIAARWRLAWPTGEIKAWLVLCLKSLFCSVTHKSFSSFLHKNPERVFHSIFNRSKMLLLIPYLSRS